MVLMIVNNISVTSAKDTLCRYQAFFNENSKSIPKTNRVRSVNRNVQYIDMNSFLIEICNISIDNFKPNFIKYTKGKFLGLSRKKAIVLIFFFQIFILL